MPSTYAHYRMGEQVRKLIDKDKDKIISRYPQLYRIGLHGPDILFYYKPLSKNPIQKIGSEIHEASGKDFFERATKVVLEHRNDERYLSYVYGVLNHFALDMCCHGFVDEWIEKSGVDHIEIESEFDRYLMVLDHVDPLSHCLTRHIAAHRENAEIISQFYPGCDKDIILKSLLDFIFYHKLFLAPGILKRKALYFTMRLLKKYDEYHGFIINTLPNPSCEESNKKLHKLYRKARSMAVELINEYDSNQLYRDEIDQLLWYNFESVMTEFEG